MFGGATIQLRSGKSGEYINLPLASSNKGWHREWFLLRNLSPESPAFTGATPKSQECWGWGLVEKEKCKVAPILEQIAALKTEVLMDEAILHTFFARRIQLVRELTTRCGCTP